MAAVSGVSRNRVLAIEGSTVVGASVDGDGNLILVRHNGSSFIAGNVRGGPGASGPAGRSLTAANVVGDDLILTYSTGEQVNAGNVRGPAGSASESGSVANVPNTTVVRTSGGRIKITDPETGDEGATKAYADGLVATQVIPEGADWNTLMSPGVYHRGLGIGGTNTPTTLAGILEVFRVSDSTSQVLQRFTAYQSSGHHVWQRQKNISWGSWHVFSSALSTSDAGPVEVRRGTHSVPIVSANSGGGGGNIVFSPAFASAANIHISLMLPSGRLSWAFASVTASGFTLSIDNHSNANSAAGTAYWRAERYL